MSECLERKKDKAPTFIFIQERITRTSETPHPQPSAFMLLEALGKKDGRKPCRGEGKVLTIESPRIIEIQKHTFFPTYVSAFVATLFLL